VVKGPITRDATGTRFYDAGGRPVEPIRLSRSGFDPAAAAKDVLDRIDRSDFLLRSRVRQDHVRAALDLGDLTTAERERFERELARQAKKRGLGVALRERVAPSVLVPVTEIPE
jgi:hypothetical protein